MISFVLFPFLPFVLGLINPVHGQQISLNLQENTINPLDEYAPSINEPCPNVSSDPLIRVFTPETQILHPREELYVETRQSTVIAQAWQDWLGNGSSIGYDFSVISGGGHWAKLGIAFSGGGFRAAQYGAGVISALDARNDSAKAAGTGGLLQVCSYLSGLSGGSWLTGSLYMNDFPLIHDLVYGNSIDGLAGWLLDLNLFIPGGIDILDHKNLDYYGSVVASVMAKAFKGFDISITDGWARMISYHFLNQTTRDNFFTNHTSHGAGQLWSELSSTSAFQQFSTPFPIVTIDSRPADSNQIGYAPLNNTVYEVTPFELGSWDPSLSAMSNLTYIGTHLANGKPDNDTSCVTGFDQAGFVMGTSSSLFNQLLDNGKMAIHGFDNAAKPGLFHVLDNMLSEVSTRAEDVANWPNPFKGIKSETFQDSNSRWLELIDGGSNLENIPLGPMFVRARGLDVIIAVDASADDSNSWPNGTSLIYTSQRLATILSSSHQAFPPIPASVDDFVSQGVRGRPTFFGCNPTQANNPEWPLVIYLPNSPPLNGDDPVTNSGTFQLGYSPLHTHLFLEQTHNNTIGGFTPDSNDPDPNFGRCLQCATVDRARMRLDPTVARSDICVQCFSQYCYEPTNPPSSSELPNRKLEFVDPNGAVQDFFNKHQSLIIGLSVGGSGGASILLLIVSCCTCAARKDKKRAQYMKIPSQPEGEEDQ